MEAIDIKNLLRVRFRELRAFADQIKVSPQLLSMVINGARRNPEIQKAIAEALGLEIGVVFPNSSKELQATACPMPENPATRITLAKLKDAIAVVVTDDY